DEGSRGAARELRRAHSRGAHAVRGAAEQGGIRMTRTPNPLNEMPEFPREVLARGARVKRVFVAYVGEHEQRFPVGVYSTRARAEAALRASIGWQNERKSAAECAARTHRSAPDPNYVDIEEFELDAPPAGGLAVSEIEKLTP